jgi:hypothetical protein
MPTAHLDPLAQAAPHMLAIRRAQRNAVSGFRYDGQCGTSGAYSRGVRVIDLA